MGTPGRMAVLTVALLVVTACAGCGRATAAHPAPVRPETSPCFPAPVADITEIL